jgi:hypothetical protein
MVSPVSAKLPVNLCENPGEEQTRLVSARHGRPHDPHRRAALHVRARRRDTTEVPGSHAIYVSNPRAVADVIETATIAALAAR